MAIEELTLQRRNENLLMTNKTLGAIGMLFSSMLFIASFFHAAPLDQPSAPSFIASLGGILYLFGAMASATAMRNLRVAGNGTGAGVLYFAQIIGLFVAMWFDALSCAAPHLKETAIFFITDLAYPFSHLLMIVVGVRLLRAKVWRGWRRVPAFLVGFALPAFFAASAIIGYEKSFYVFPLMTTTGFFSLGLAVFTSNFKK